jgi:hypothetical protein
MAKRRSQDPWNDPDAKAWVAHTAETLPGMIKDSVITLSLVPDGDPDIKFCVELGMCIMLNKPILAVVRPGTKVPERLVRVADLIIECNIENDADRDKLAEAIKDFGNKYAPKDPSPES